MAIWLTGCAGFLGTRLAAALTKKGFDVVGLSRRPSTTATQAVSIDLASPEARPCLTELLARAGPPEAVIHAASRQPGPHGLLPYVSSNIVATAAVLDVLHDLPPKQIIYTSTLMVYEQPAPLPVPEEARTYGGSPYAITKFAGEQLMRAFQSRSQVIVFRLPSLYGAGQTDSFVDGLRRLAVENRPIELFRRGENIEDALHVDDVVVAIGACVADPPASRFLCLNLGCGRPVTTREYAEAIVQAFASHSPLLPVDDCASQRFDIYADIAAARRELRFTPTPLVAALERYAEELRA